MARHVILIPGWRDTPSLFRRMERRLRAAGLETTVFPLEPNTCAAPFEELATDLAGFVDRRFGPDARVSLLGFSMGGLVARYYVQRLGGSARVDRLICLSTPHHGTLTAWLLARPGARQMRAGSAFLRELNEDAASLGDCRVSCLWSRLDPMILPPWSARLEAADERTFLIPLHAWIPRSGRVIEEVVRLLEDAAED